MSSERGMTGHGGKADALTTPLLTTSISHEDLRACAAVRDRHAVFRADDETSPVTGVSRGGKEVSRDHGRGALACRSEGMLPLPAGVLAGAAAEGAAAVGAAAVGAAGEASSSTSCAPPAGDLRGRRRASSPAIRAPALPPSSAPRRTSTGAAMGAGGQSQMVDALAGLEAPPPSEGRRLSTIHRAWRMVDREYLQPHFGGRRYTEWDERDSDEDDV